MISKAENIKIYCPLPYGDLINQAGKKVFGGKFISLRNFFPFNDHLGLLSKLLLEQQGFKIRDIKNIDLLTRLAKKKRKLTRITPDPISPRPT